MHIKHLSLEEKIPRAVSLVQSASKIIRATETLSDKPVLLPEQYMEAVREKMTMGVELHRIAFGTTEQLSLFHQMNSCESPQYQCWLAPPHLYQRMLMADDKQLMFAKENEFFFTTASDVIQEFSSYFHLILSNPKTTLSPCP